MCEKAFAAEHDDVLHVCRHRHLLRHRLVWCRRPVGDPASASSTGTRLDQKLLLSISLDLATYTLLTAGRKKYEKHMNECPEASR